MKTPIERTQRMGFPSKPAAAAPKPAAVEPVKETAAPETQLTSEEIVDKSPIVDRHEAKGELTAGLIAQLKLLKSEICEKWAGKAGANPFIWVKQNIDTIIYRIHEGDTSPETIKRAKQLIADGSDKCPTVKVELQEVTGERKK